MPLNYPFTPLPLVLSPLPSSSRVATDGGRRRRARGTVAKQRMQAAGRDSGGAQGLWRRPSRRRAGSQAARKRSGIGSDAHGRRRQEERRRRRVRGDAQGCRQRVRSSGGAHAEQLRRRTGGPPATHVRSGVGGARADRQQRGCGAALAVRSLISKDVRQQRQQGVR